MGHPDQYDRNHMGHFHQRRPLLPAHSARDACKHVGRPRGNSSYIIEVQLTQRRQELCHMRGGIYRHLFPVMVVDIRTGVSRKEPFPKGEKKLQMTGIGLTCFLSFSVQ
jgi:hypothetical protein